MKPSSARPSQIITLTRFQLDGWIITTWAFKTESKLRVHISKLISAWTEDDIERPAEDTYFAAHKSTLQARSTSAAKYRDAFHSLANNRDGEAWQIELHTL